MSAEINPPRATEALSQIMPSRRTALVAGAACIAVSLLASCSEAELPPSPTLPSAQAERPSKQVDEALSQRGPCVPGSNFLSGETGHELRKKQASKCAEYYQKGKVALVNFGHPDGQAKKVAKSMEEAMNIVSEGLVKAKVEVVAATPAAKKSLEAATSIDRGCIDSDYLETWGSTNAAATMPRLKQYDHIIALNTKVACSTELGGVADRFSHRYADIFEHRKPSISNAKSGFSRNSASPDVRIVTGVHEWGHLLGLGHEGEPGEQLYGNTKSIVDLRQFVKGNDYREYTYRRNRLMGQAVDVPYKYWELDVVHKNILHRPLQILNKEKPRAHRLTDNSDIVFDVQDVTRGHYAKLQLDEVVGLKPENKPSMLDQFNAVALVPGIDPASFPPTIQKVDVILQQDLTGNTVDFSSLAYVEKAQHARRMLKIGKQAVEVIFKDGQVTMKVR